MEPPAPPRCATARAARFRLDGVLRAYLDGASEQWLKIAPAANPGMLEMLEDRDRTPPRDAVPWAGEFAGKYLTGATQVLRLTRDPGLRAVLTRFVRELISLQDADGYLGPWPAGARLANRVPRGNSELLTWDTWGHYHIMLGLLLWHDDTGDAAALTSARRIGDLLCEKYLGAKSPRLVDTGSTEMNLAPAHGLCLLHARTGEARYLALARQLVDEEFGARDGEGGNLAGDYLNGSLAGRDFFELPRPRWESLHPIMAVVELYALTGDVKYREAYEQIWSSIARLDRHNNGGFSSGEQAQGNPFHPGAIETCCTIARMALSVEMLKLTGESAVADELELSLLNSVLGMHSHTGRWATYNTPMDGVRRASAHEIVFQSREGTPELNCCSVNSARGFGLLSDWALMQDAEGLILNYYGPGSIAARVPGGRTVTLKQTTDYPRDGAVRLAVAPSRAAEFTLKLRIPRWSGRTRVRLNGKPVRNVRAGTYLALRRRWKRGDRVELHFDMALHFWVGQEECAGRISVFRGPLLLAYDRRFNTVEPQDLPALDPHALRARVVPWKGRLTPLLLVRVRGAGGREIRLCDFGSAGASGSPYRSWLPLSPTAKPVPEYFAASADDLFVSRLARIGSRCRDYFEKKKVASCESYIRPTHLVEILRGLRADDRRWALDHERARAIIARQPDAPPARRLERVLGELGRDWGVGSPAFEALLRREETEIRGRFSIPYSLRDLACSPLQPAVSDIAATPGAAAEMTFQPVTAAGEDLCDIRAFHGGAHGLVYIRGRYTAAAAGAGVLLYGADGPVKVWVNDQPVDCRPAATNPARAGQYRVDVAWRAGGNTVTFALCTNHGRAWGVFAGADREE